MILINFVSYILNAVIYIQIGSRHMPPKRQTTSLLSPAAAPSKPLRTKKRAGELTEGASLERMIARIKSGAYKKEARGYSIDPNKRESSRKAKALARRDRADEARQAKQLASLPVDSDLAPVYMNQKTNKKNKKRIKSKVTVSVIPAPKTNPKTKPKTAPDWKNRVSMADVRAAIKKHNEKYCITKQNGTKLALISRLEQKTDKVLDSVRR